MLCYRFLVILCQLRSNVYVDSFAFTTLLITSAKGLFSSTNNENSPFIIKINNLHIYKNQYMINRTRDILKEESNGDIWGCY